MASDYKEADLTTIALLKEVIEAHYKDLAAVGVTIDIVFAYCARDEQGEPTGPALKKHSFPVSSLSTITNLLNRVMGQKDCMILLDGDTWPEMSDEERKALLDHALCHFDLSRNVDGEPIKDKQGRCKLKFRLPDRSFRWFDLVASRNGENSVEFIQAQQLFAECAQVYFPFVKGLPKSQKPLKVLPDKKPRGSKKKDKEPPADPAEMAQMKIDPGAGEQAGRDEEESLDAERGEHEEEEEDQNEG